MTFYDDEAHDDLDLDLTPPPVGAQYHPAETEETLYALRDMVENARDVPLSASSMIQKDEALALIDEAIARLPEELRAATWLLKEREEYLARMRHEADEIIAQAQARAERMVQRTEVVKAAEERAFEIVDTAQADARRLRHEVEDFCDQKLASFEIVLDRTMKLVGAGRAKLQGTNLLADAAAAAQYGITGVPDEASDDAAHDDAVRAVAPTLYDDEAASSAPSAYDHPSEGMPLSRPAAFDELSALSRGLNTLGREGDGYDDDDDYDESDELVYGDPEWDDDGSLPFEEPPARPRLTVVDDDYSHLPPPPDERETIRGAASTFFDQDLA